MRKKTLNPNGRNNDSQAYKIVQTPKRKQMGPRKLKEGSSKLMEIIRNGKQVKWVKGAQRKEFVNGVGTKANKTPKVKDMVIGSGKPKRCSKSPRECKNGIGQGCPKE